MSGFKLRAFGGALLQGHEWVRVLYLDESGIGKIDADPHLVVAGVIVNSDTQWRPIKEHLASLLADATPTGQPLPACLHAKDIYHGNNEFPKEYWSEELRHGLLDKIAMVPCQFKVPIVWGLVDRQAMANQFPNEEARSLLVDCYSQATLMALFQAEWYMRNMIGPTEVLSITIEKNNELQRRIGEVYRYASSPGILSEIKDGEYYKDLLPLTKIVDEPSFQPKTGASALQLADFCAFVLKRSARQQRFHERFTKPLAPATLRWAPGQDPIISGPFFRA